MNKTAARKTETSVGRPKKTPGDRPEKKFKVIAVRATEEWADWADRASAHCRMNLSTAIDVALSEFFRAKGFEEPPPPRY